MIGLIGLIDLLDLTLEIEAFLLERFQRIKQFISVGFIEVATRQCFVESGSTFFKTAQISSQVAKIIRWFFGRHQGVRIDRKHINTSLSETKITIGETRVHTRPVSQTSLSIPNSVVMQLEMVRQPGWGDLIQNIQKHAGIGLTLARAAPAGIDIIKPLQIAAQRKGETCEQGNRP